MKTKYILLLLIFFWGKSFSQTLKDCTECSYKIIKPEQLRGLNIDELRLLVNEISARNGYRFENSRFQDYFEGKTWYKSKNDNTKVTYNAVEKQNIKILQDMTGQLKGLRTSLINQLKGFKMLIFTGNTIELKKQFGFAYEQQNQSSEQKLLREVFNKIDLNDINYYKNTGLNSIIVDNGFVKIVYEISIDGDHVNLVYNYMTHSKIIKGFDEFSDYRSESEYMYNWQFEFKNGKLKFTRMAVAG